MNDVAYVTTYSRDSWIKQIDAMRSRPVDASDALDRYDGARLAYRTAKRALREAEAELERLAIASTYDPSRLQELSDLFFDDACEVALATVIIDDRLVEVLPSPVRPNIAVTQHERLT